MIVNRTNEAANHTPHKTEVLVRAKQGNRVSVGYWRLRKMGCRQWRTYVLRVNERKKARWTRALRRHVQAGKNIAKARILNLLSMKELIFSFIGMPSRIKIPREARVYWSNAHYKCFRAIGLWRDENSTGCRGIIARMQNLGTPSSLGSPTDYEWVDWWLETILVESVWKAKHILTELAHEIEWWIWKPQWYRLLESVDLWKVKSLRVDRRFLLRLNSAWQF